MKVNKKILCLPPFLSTPWDNVLSLHVRGTILVVSLKHGETVTVPNLAQDELENVFATHATYLDEKAAEDSQKTVRRNVLFAKDAFEFPFRIGFSALDSLGSALQHNSSQSNSPKLPVDILEKIRAIAKIIAPDDAMAVPKPEPHCNCMHCQIARAIQEGLSFSVSPSIEEEEEEEEVTDEDLKFQQWEIIQKEDKVFTVINRLDAEETYNVYLGTPVGCTCGKESCEHIVAVLKS